MLSSLTRSSSRFGVAIAAQARAAAASTVAGTTLQPARTWDDGVADGFKAVTSDELFKGKKVVLFGVPGAFTGVCSQAHVPGFASSADAFKALGVDTIACVSVNDAYTMNMWAQKMGVTKEQVSFFGDSDGSFTKSLGLEVDLNAAGLGPGMRSNRYSMLVEDGNIVKMNVEESAGDLKVSDAETLLSQMK
eukprot:CAMPEP_0177769568 /NCGR_PEP_ID=MMETSP0491_2-20121128/10401_1 /TAXON_ID=63592 /ORGANISM="Tetraselmis chuii, Strain PLY429" /LENGTH=190 /DNA_ID=CAMNT_0019286605 /DNA_START=208 /DNA_END=780 /DNA_ORIENTATION=-